MVTTGGMSLDDDRPSGIGATGNHYHPRDWYCSEEDAAHSSWFPLGVLVLVVGELNLGTDFVSSGRVDENAHRRTIPGGFGVALLAVNRTRFHHHCRDHHHSLPCNLFPARDD